MAERVIEHDGDDNDANPDIHRRAVLAADMELELAALWSGIEGDPDDVRFITTVSRIENGKEAKCYECAPNEFDIFRKTRDEFGPGQYRVKLYKNGRIFRRSDFNIASPVKQERQSDDVTRALLDELREMRREITAMKSAPRADIDPMQAMIQGITLATGMFAKIQVPTASAPTMREMVETMLMLKKLDGDKPSLLGGLDDVEKLLSIADRFRGEGGEKDDGIMGVIKSFAPAIVPAVTALARQPQMRVTQPRPKALPPAPTSAPGATPTPTVQPTTEKTAEEKVMDTLKLAVAPAVPFLVKAAKNAGNDAERIAESAHTYAALAVDMAGDERARVLRAFAERDNAAQKLTEWFPNLAPYADWVAEFRECLLDIFYPERLTGDDDNDTDAPESTPGAEDVSHHTV